MDKAASYCYKVMPFGLKNAEATDQRIMHQILSPMLSGNVQAYVDDMVVTLIKADEHVTLGGVVRHYSKVQLEAQSR